MYKTIRNSEIKVCGFSDSIVQEATELVRLEREEVYFITKGSEVVTYVKDESSLSKLLQKDGLDRSTRYTLRKGTYILKEVTSLECNEELNKELKFWYICLLLEHKSEVFFRINFKEGECPSKPVNLYYDRWARSWAYNSEETYLEPILLSQEIIWKCPVYQVNRDSLRDVLVFLNNSDTKNFTEIYVARRYSFSSHYGTTRRVHLEENKGVWRKEAILEKDTITWYLGFDGKIVSKAYQTLNEAVYMELGDLDTYTYDTYVKKQGETKAKFAGFVQKIEGEWHFKGLDAESFKNSHGIEVSV